MRLYSAFADMEYCFPAVFVCLDAHIRLMLCILGSLNIDNKKYSECIAFERSFFLIKTFNTCNWISISG